MRSRIDDAWRGDAAISSGVPWVLKYAATLHAGTTSGHANGNPEQIHHPAGFHDGGFRPGRKAASMMGLGSRQLQTTKHVFSPVLSMLETTGDLICRSRI